jgi:hypothetical protein
MSGTGSLDVSHIVDYMIYVGRPLAPVTLVLNNIRLLPNAPDTGRYDKIVDKFGQYAKADWPGKIHSDVEMRQTWEKERVKLLANSAVPDRDEYGGWTGGPQLEATGNFRTIKLDGRWWFVDPAGRLFLSLGVNGCNSRIPTLVMGREAMFADLPTQGDPLATHFAKRAWPWWPQDGLAYDFYGANLERKFGADYLGPWRSETSMRFKEWGLNTISGHTDLGSAVPYAAQALVANQHAMIRGAIDDPWDPRFAADASNWFGISVRPVANDPMCIGIMVENEMSWGSADGGRATAAHYHLAFSTLSLKGDSPAKQIFVGMLRSKYGDIAKFNASWGVNVSDWDSLLANPLGDPPALNTAIEADASAFLTAHAQQWFHVVRDEVKKIAPNKLFLGCRFSYLEYTPEAVAAAAQYADVLTFNIYGVTSLDPSRWSFLKALGKPVMVSEFHFGTTDRGMFGYGDGPAKDEAERAQFYREFVGNLLDNPVVIGEQWFEYQDEPLLGENINSENFGIGFVSITDQPYPELVDAARSVNSTAYTRHAASKETKIRDEN